METSKVWISPLYTEKSPTTALTLGQRQTAGSGGVSQLLGLRSSGRSWGRCPRPPGSTRRAGLWLATRGVHLPGRARRFLTAPGGGEGGEGNALPSRPLPRALPRLAEPRAAAPAAAARSSLPRCRGAAGRERAGNFAASGGAAPPGACASVSVAGGLLGAAAERGSGEKEAASAHGGPGGRGPARRRRRRPKLRRGCAQDAFLRCGRRPCGRRPGLALGSRFLLPAWGSSNRVCRRRSGSSIPSPGGTPERRSRRLEQEGRVAAPALPGWPCPARPVRVANNGAERRRDSRVRPAVVEEVDGLRVGWAGRRPPPLACWSLPARRASPAPSPGLPSASPTAARSGEYGASARVII